MTTITYSIATPADAALLADGRLAFMNAMMGPRPADAVAALRQHLVAYFEEATGTGQYIGVIASHGNVVVATGGIAVQRMPGNFGNAEGRRGYIMNMYTQPSFRRQGIGRQVFDLLIHTARQRGIHSFELHATPDGEPLYRQSGFTKHSEPTYRKHFFDLNTSNR